MGDKCLCGKEFDKYKWECIPIKREMANGNGWRQQGVPEYSYLYVCPECSTVKHVK